jgi:isochorismate synthase
MNTHITQQITTLIHQRQSFAAWRQPDHTHIHLQWQDQAQATLHYNIEDLNHCSGYLIAPFAPSETNPIILLHCDHEATYSQPTNTPRPRVTTPTIHIPLPGGQAAYTPLYQAFHAQLLTKQYTKLVLSHSIQLPHEAHFSPAEAFQIACTTDPSAYVYLIHTPHTGLWLGRTPELLLSGLRDRWQTVAMAGTQSHQTKEWDKKNKTEHKLVAQYIRTQLATLGIESEEGRPHTTPAANLQHLKSDILFTLPRTDRLGTLLQHLHPTPAVCGLPKTEALQYIQAHEAHDRRYYTGFLGTLNPDHNTQLYVNLRCMHIDDTTCTLYAGGGLLPSSDLHTEWQEIEHKMQTMLRLLILTDYAYT